MFVTLITWRRELTRFPGVLRQSRCVHLQPGRLVLCSLSRLLLVSQRILKCLDPCRVRLDFLPRSLQFSQQRLDCLRRIALWRAVRFGLPREPMISRRGDPRECGSNDSFVLGKRWQCGFWWWGNAICLRGLTRCCCRLGCRVVHLGRWGHGGEKKIKDLLSSLKILGLLLGGVQFLLTGR